MSESFDPYVQWLGIRDPKGRPNHYRLLGVDPFESDPNVLENAADRQMAHVRTFQTGRHSAESQRLLNELAAAKVCLLNLEKKAEYDAGLCAEEQPAEPAESSTSPPVPAAEPPVVPPPVSPPPPVVSDQPPVLVTTLPEPIQTAPVEFGPQPAPMALSAKQRSPIVSTAVTVLGSMILVLVGLIVWATVYSGLEGEKRGTTGTAADPKAGPEADPEPQPGNNEVSPGPDSKPESGPDAPGPDPPGPDPPQPDLPEPDIPQVDLPEPDTPKPDTPKPDTPEPDMPEPPEDKRLPIPGRAAESEALREIRDLFKDDYAGAKDRHQEDRLAGMLLKKAVDTKDDPVARYVLFTEARDYAIAAGNSELFLKTLRSIGQEYSVDWLIMATETLQRPARKPHDTDANRAMADTALGLVGDAVAGEEYDLAMMLAEASRLMARDCRPRDLARTKRAVAVKRSVEALRDAEKVLAEQPDDPQANLTAGKYYCFVENDFDRGLPMIRKGSDPLLAGLAEADLAGPSEAAAMVALADRWWDASEAALEADQQWPRNRAAYWYKRALRHVSGLTEDRIKHRLEELGRGSSQPRN